MVPAFTIFSFDTVLVNTDLAFCWCDNMSDWSGVSDSLSGVVWCWLASGGCVDSATLGGFTTGISISDNSFVTSWT